MLELARPVAGFLPVTSTKALLEVIQRRAITQWGEKAWRAELARATVEILQRTDPDATYEKRRRQIYNVFDTWGCNADTLLALVEAVGCRLQLVCTEVKVIEL